MRMSVLAKKNEMKRMTELANEKRSRGRRCILKPQYEMGDEVYVAWMGADRAGRVMSYREVPGVDKGGENGGGVYGPIRIYQIKFDNEQVSSRIVIGGIPEHVVVSKRDYLLSTSNGVAHDWKGVRNVVDESSDDLWAKTVGWYAVVIGGRGEADTEQFFSRLSDAVRAYDASVVRIKGDKTERGELNLPEEWNWLFTTSDTVEHNKELLQEKEKLQCKLDDICKQENGMAIKVMLDDERLKHLNMQIKLRAELRESYNKEMEATKKNYEEEKALAMEMATGELQLQHQQEKERLMAELKEYYEDEMAKAVEEANAELRGKMQSEIDREKNKALIWLRTKVMEQQRQQQQRKSNPGAQRLDPSNKTHVRACSDNTLEFLNLPKRAKLVGSRDLDFHANAANDFRVVSPATREGGTKQVESMVLSKSPNDNSQLPLPNGGSSQKCKPLQKELVELPLPSPLCLAPITQAKAEIVSSELPANRRTAADEEQKKEIHGHRTADETLLDFAAEKMDCHSVSASAESLTDDPSTAESVPAAIYVTITTENSSPKSSDPIKKKTKKPERTMDTTCAIEPTNEDILFGRGGYVNTHPGNIKFREKALELRPWYEVSTNEKKYNISKVLIESVKGRFLEKASDGLWHEVSGNGIRKKASQALRERVRGKMILSTPTKKD